jgi:hypothetical protein
MSTIVSTIAFFGMIVYLVGAFGLVRAALLFQGRNGWLALWLLPLAPLSLGFAIQHWRLARKYCLTMLVGIGLVGIAIALNPS